MGEPAKPFKPSPLMKLIYWIYYTAFYAAPIAVLLASIALLTGQVLVSALLACILLVPETIILGVWIPRFYESIVFSLEKDHCYARYGVWWRVVKRVPYNLVSEVRLRQGPLQRRLGLANVDVYTPATGAMRPELTYFQLPADLASRVAEELRRRAGILTSRERRVIEEEMLSELRAIRRLLEEYLRRSSGGG
ncbi:MAG: PH domain-containing protein [Crenarchaeota archaeon]|nr:PH domain-containing protein [Thermoproteota archaeon]